MNDSPGSHAENRQVLLKDGSGMPQVLRADELDREAKLLLRILSPFLGRPVSREQISLVRQGFRFLAMMLGRRVPVASVVQHRVEGSAGPIDFRIYTPKGPSDLKPGFLWCHGGGFVVGDLDSTDAICRSVARAAKAVVVAVRYRLAPEHDLYAGREDFLAALNWIAAHGPSVGIDDDSSCDRWRQCRRQYRGCCGTGDEAPWRSNSLVASAGLSCDQPDRRIPVKGGERPRVFADRGFH